MVDILLPSLFPLDWAFIGLDYPSVTSSLG